MLKCKNIWVFLTPNVWNVLKKYQFQASKMLCGIDFKTMLSEPLSEWFFLEYYSITLLQKSNEMVSLSSPQN